ncbi:D-alanyl-D-alanine carboxypeptidase [Candidatus Shapirobacteria bacterium]|nr:D-alanyl-D-alanine carboxypeptidase [Candidatus Shapirobacteria bacterium]
MRFLKFLPLFLLGLTFLFLPGNSYYETLNLTPAAPKKQTAETLPALPPLPQKRLVLPLSLSAKASLLVDYSSGVFLWRQSEEEKLPPASLTKLMTALIVLEEMDPEQIVTVGNVENYGQVMGLVAGEQLKVGDLLEALLIFSANDAAYALADAYPGGRKVFIDRANVRAQELGLKNTHFVNPNGEDNPNHYSTARDLARLAQRLWRFEEFRQIISQDQKTVCAVNGLVCHSLSTTDALLGQFPGLVGGKTGFTEQAGECFLSFWEVDGVRLLSVVLGSGDRFGDTQKLLQWGLASFNYSPVEAVSFIQEGSRADK